MKRLRVYGMINSVLVLLTSSEVERSAVHPTVQIKAWLMASLSEIEIIIFRL